MCFWKQPSNVPKSEGQKTKYLPFERLIFRCVNYIPLSPIFGCEKILALLVGGCHNPFEKKMIAKMGSSSPNRG